MSSTRQLHPDSWELTQSAANSPTLGVMGETLADLVDEGHPIAVATADLKYSNGLDRFQARHPDRFVQFGISEQNMVTAAAGMATTGLIPYAATFASFLSMLCCEQIHTDVAYPRLPVRLVGHHAGISMGFYGTSHHANGDLAIMRAIPDLAVVAPADGAQWESALRATVDHPGPVYFRIGRGRDPEVYPRGERFVLGRATVHGAGADLTIIATGSCVHAALEATARLSDAGLSVGMIDMATIKPLDRDAILAAASASERLMTVEEHNVLGGLGSAVSEVLSEAGRPTVLHRHGIRDVFSLIGPPSHLYRHYRLDADGIAAEATELIEGRLAASSRGVGITGYQPPEADRR